ncbi:DUF1836 domain-containing protein [Clostridium botulinum]|uniref:DUF1836 domain-containing protein n=1 Tax=Clostridium botulinum C/D str. DC5 TaxID=1443128 RepID=A0A0A0I8U3_CLOBO|nr:DUF1836 domain-containing protein [Clostridium botulinum]KEI06758.1 hypothetical protein Z952_03055 [Clostridium botulinum C/D str. BKT75002]KEI10868.1 hypothetical protein Z954_09660 [Clostridium botulinum C/D str. BKT2873]KGM93501.1 hypothetical protein Z956_11550 [Clostridium botulinum D str. CCUG 7971]KGM97889.1 hypothetical protein Z955_11880 [Clostridium botulinum C/D str. DC5]KOC49212.1 hypothetical protein ADU88_06800 [Clostridium botulinum]
MKNIQEVLQNINDFAKEISKNSLVTYEDLPQYSLFLSQVIDYLNDRFEEEKYTNNIVQNYIKNEVISKPEDGKKRGYTKLHLTQLVLLSYMRPILTTDEIKKVFALAFNEINDRSDDIISWEKAYKIFDKIQNESFDNFLNVEFFNEEKLQNFIGDDELKEDEEERILVFLVVMSLIAKASAIKKIAKKIVDEYGEKHNNK